MGGRVRSHRSRRRPVRWHSGPTCAQVNGLFACKGVGGVGVGRSGSECRWRRGRRAHPATCRAQLRMEGCGGEWFGVPVPRLFLCVGALHPIRRQCTSSVRVQRPISGAAPPCLWRLSGLWGSSELGLSSAWGTSWCLCGASYCGSSEMSHVIPRHVFQTLKSHRWNCNVLGAVKSSGTRITCEFWLMRLPRRAPVFGRRPTTLSTIPGTLRPGGLVCV